jgi:hypothetical protein
LKPLIEALPGSLGNVRPGARATCRDKSEGRALLWPPPATASTREIAERLGLMICVSANSILGWMGGSYRIDGKVWPAKLKMDRSGWRNRLERSHVRCYSDHTS